MAGLLEDVAKSEVSFGCANLFDLYDPFIICIEIEVCIACQDET